MCGTEGSNSPFPHVPGCFVHSLTGGSHWCCEVQCGITFFHSTSPLEKVRD